MRRLFDIGFALFSLAVLGLPMLAIAAAVALNNGHPVIFKQTRMGLNGKPFDIYKFRSMTTEKGSDGQLLPDEDRLTKLGWFLRRYSLDELPQLFNIIKGEMSFVGPRPMCAELTDVPRERHLIRPGLTGLAQIGPRRDFYRGLTDDIEYVRTRSAWLDLKIIAKTFAVVARGEDGGPAPRAIRVHKTDELPPPPHM